MKRFLTILLAFVLVFTTVFTAVGCGKKTCESGKHVYEKGICTICGEKEPTQKKLMRIGVTTQPNKTEYIVGETFDKTGMVVTAFYNDSTKEEVTDYTIDKTGALTREDNRVVVSYGGKKVSVKISVRAAFVLNEVLSIESAENHVYTVEAEDMDFGWCVNSNDHSLQPNIEAPMQQFPVTSGGKCASTLSVMGNKFGFIVNSKAAAKLTLVIRASATHVNIDIDNMMSVTWNSAVITSGKTLPWADGGWFNWAHAVYTDLDLKEGKNELLLTVTGNNAPNCDCFYLIVSPTGEEKLPETIEDNAPAGEKTIVNVESAENRVFTVEAESLDYSSCVSMRGDGTTHSVEEPVQEYPVTSGGKSVGALSVAGNKFGFTVNSAVNVKATIVMRAAPTETDMNLDEFIKVTWNGVEVKSGKTLKWNTDHAHWFDWDHAYFISLDVKEGKNDFEVTIIARNEQGAVNAPNFDCFYLIVAPTGEEELLGTVGKTAHECKHKCPECGLCLDTECQDPVCKDKCAGHEEPVPACDLVVENAENGVYTIEAENLDYSKCVNSNDPNSTHNVETPPAGYPTTSGGKSVGALSVKDNKFSLSIYAKQAAKINIVMRAAATHLDLNADDIMTAKWNGAEVKSGKLFVWNPDNAHWFDWDHAFFKDLDLAKGLNTLEIVVKERVPGSVNFVNLDGFYVVVSPNGNEVLPECMSTITVSSTAGLYKVEAERLDYSACLSSRDDGTHYGVEANSDGGTSVCALSKEGNKITITVNNLSDGDLAANFVMRASANGANMNLDELLKIRVNGIEIKTGATLTWTGSWNVCETVKAAATFKKGYNEIEIEVLNGGCPNLDYFAVEVA